MGKYYVVTTFAMMPPLTEWNIDMEDRRELEARVVQSEKDQWEVGLDALRKLMERYPESKGWIKHTARADVLTIELHGLQMMKKENAGEGR